MKRLALGLTVVCLTLVAGAASKVTDYAKAVDCGKDAVVLCVGSGWMKDCEKYKTVFGTLAARTPGDFVFALYDRPSGLSEEQVKALGKLPVEFFGYPCLIYIDNAGRPIAQYEGISLEALAKIGGKLGEHAKMCATRDAAIKNARTAKDPRTKAKLIGRALAPWLDPIIDTYSERAIGSYQAAAKPFVKEMREADPADPEGWAEKYEFCYAPIMEKTICKGGEAAARAEIERLLGKSAFRPIQRQFVYGMLFKVELDQVRDDEAPLDRAIRALRTGIDIAPRTTLAQAMRNLLAYYTEPVRLRDMRWTSRDNRPRWQAAECDCSRDVHDSGRYLVEFHALTDGTQIRKVSFEGGKIGTQKPGTQTWACDFPGGRPILKFELKGSGWFSGTGEIRITKGGT